MKKSVLMMCVLALCAWSVPTLAGPSVGDVSMKMSYFGVGIGFQNGSATVNLNGQTGHFKVSGVHFLGGGISEFKGTGKVIGAEFSRGSSELSMRGRHALDDIAKAVKNHGYSTVTIVAYANDAPSSRANRILSEQRARAVADYLRQNGVGDQGISARGRGRPVLLPASKIAQKNPWYRRVEITVKGKEN